MVAIIVFTGAIVSMAIAPGVDWLHRRKFPRSLSVILIYLLLLGLLIGFIYLIVPQIIQQITAIVPRVESYYLDFRAGLVSSPYSLIRQIAGQLPPAISLRPIPIPPAPDGNSLDGVTQTLNTAGAALGGLFTLFAILLIGFYWTLESERVLRSLLLPVPVDKRESTREVIAEIATRVGEYVRGQGLLAGTIGIVTLAAYLAIGLPSALALALLAGMFELVPVLGPALAAIPAILVALATDPSKVLLVIGISALIQFLGNSFLAPRVMYKTVGVNPVVTLLSIAAFGSLFGFAGLLLAIPIAAVIQILIDRSLLHPTAPVLEAPTGRDRLSKLRYDAQELVLDVRKLIRRKESGDNHEESDEVEDAIEAIALDLDSVVAQTVQTEPLS
jgi:predicted PurR-regulated permease PerM